VVVCGLAIATVAGDASAQAWPGRPIKIIVPYAPGASDREARALAAEMEKDLGQPVQVENREGGGGTVGANFVARQAPADGYTLLYSTSAVIAVAPHLRKLPYEPEDLVAVARVNAGPHYMAARADAPFKSLTALIAHAKANPGAVSFGSAGPGSATHLAGEAFAKAAGVKLNHIPFQGLVPSVTAAVGGNVDLVIGLPLFISPQVEAGKLMPVAQFGASRAKGLPQVTTLKEAGIDLVLAPNFGFFAAKAAPKEAIARFAAAVEKAMNAPAFQELARKNQASLGFMGPEAFDREARQEHKFYGMLIAGLGMAKQ
jgi:tripartite-type tricarboxylate transporter receptor subunit TctC